MYLTIRNNIHLIALSTKREVLARYQSSALGVLWGLITPILMAALYAVVFTQYMSATWGGKSISAPKYFLNIYIGLLIFNFFSDALAKSAVCVLVNPNYVKKIRFPLELLPVITVLGALVNLCFGLILWIVMQVLFGDVSGLSFRAVIGLMPMILTALALSWFLAALAVYVKDIVQLLGLILAALMLISPVFYPAEAWGQVREMLIWNPIAYAIEGARGAIDIYKGYGIFWQLLITGLFTCGCYKWFVVLKGGFSDVL